MAGDLDQSIPSTLPGKIIRSGAGPLPEAIDLAERIRQLQADRRKHIRAVEVIDDILGQISRAIGGALHSRIPGSHGPAAGMPPLGGSAAAPAEPPLALSIDPLALQAITRRKGRFNHTAEKSVLDFISRCGHPTTADINRHWRDEGRRGTANVTLLRLLQHGRIRRIADPAVRGSRYALAAGDRSDSAGSGTGPDSTGTDAPGPVQ